MRFVPFAVLVTATLVGCSNRRGTVSLTPPPTLVAVDPAEFLGSVPCLDAPGAMRTYVATLFDITTEAGTLGPSGLTENLAAFELPSSEPTSCRNMVAFGFVSVGHEYVASIQGFDRTDLRPLASGSSVMVDPDTGDAVPARWTGTCGVADPDGGVVADDASLADGAIVEQAVRPALSVQQRTITVRGCTELTEQFGSNVETSVEVSIDDALGLLECGEGADQVARFEATLGASTGAADCGGQVVLTGGAVDAVNEIAVVAFASGETDPTWATTCFATPRESTQVRASCDPLVPLDDGDAGAGGAAGSAAQ